MRGVVALLGLVLLAGPLAGCITGGDEVAPTETAPMVRSTAGDDAVVIAVLDSGINPYHLDWAAASMPQHQNDDPSDDLPLDRPPHEWLRGFPAPDAFASYTGLALTLSDDPDAEAADLIEADEEVWSDFDASDEAAIQYGYVPGTKIVGLVSFRGSPVAESGAHGARAASVAVGGIYGSCPECLLVFVHGPSEVAIEWILQQDWIDAVTNSYGFSLVMRDRLYSGSDTELQRAATERGQTVFFSAGNGQANTFTAPNPTLFSSQEGPDWIVTVGAVAPTDGASYTGHGKPADIASVGSQYPSQGGPTISDDGTFGGTSSATPTITGTYGRALWVARTTLAGPSRIQADGVVATGDPYACGEARPECELADGLLTAGELRTRLFEGAIHTAAGLRPGLVPVTLATTQELEFMSEGHGTYFARLLPDAAWAEERDRITAPMLGDAAAIERPDGERDWMVVDSYCRQHLWGAWSGGYFVEGETELPATSPLWPLRTAYQEVCPSTFPPV